LPGRARHLRQSVAVLSGPATYAGAHWRLPALEVLGHTPDDLEGLLAAGYQRPNDWGREVVTTAIRHRKLRPGHARCNKMNSTR